MPSGNPEDFEPWPEMKPERLLDMYPESELVKIYAIPQNTVERTQAWEALGVTDPLKQKSCEIELDNLIKGLVEKHKEMSTLEDASKAALRNGYNEPMGGFEPPAFDFIWGK